MRRDVIGMAILVALTIGCRDAAAGSSAPQAPALVEPVTLHDDAFRGVLGVGPAETPLYIISVGWR